MIYRIAQLIGFIAFFFSIIAYHLNKKDDIFKCMIISGFFNLIHYLLIGAYSGCITKVLSIIRDSIVVKKEKNNRLNSKIVLFILIVLYVIASILTYEKLYSILPLIAAIIYLIFIWNGSKETVKKTAFFIYFLWLAYNICVLSISGITSNIISIISTFIAVKRNKTT